MQHRMERETGLEQRIVMIRDERVLLDVDLAAIYGVSTRRLNEQVRRNIGRFPLDFMFQLNAIEFEVLRSQFATAKLAKRRSPPLAFTEHGAIMVAGILNSPTAVAASVFVVRAFVRLRRTFFLKEQVVVELENLKERVDLHDASLTALFELLDQLLTRESEPRDKIGFRTDSTK